VNGEIRTDAAAAVRTLSTEGENFNSLIQHLTKRNAIIVLEHVSVSIGLTNSIATVQWLLLLLPTARKVFEILPQIF
jgi:hypothetical protein